MSPSADPPNPQTPRPATRDVDTWLRARAHRRIHPGEPQLGGGQAQPKPGPARRRRGVPDPAQGRDAFIGLPPPDKNTALRRYINRRRRW